MLRDMLPYLGFDLKRIPENADIFFVLNNAPKSWHAFVFFGLLLTTLVVVYKLYKKEHSVCPMYIKKFLGILRCFILILICLIFLDPALGISIKKIVEPQILLLLDDSASMNIQDKYISAESKAKVNPFLGKGDSASRLDLLKLAMKEYSIDEQLKAKGSLHIFTFDKGLNDEVLKKNVLESVQQLQVDKSSTDISNSVKNAVNLNNGKKVAGIILMSDGRTNSGLPLVDLAQFLQSQKIPVYIIGLGNSEKAKNIKISDLWLPERVFKDDPFTIQTKISGSQMNAESVDLQLIEIPLNEQGEPMKDKFKLVDHKTVTFNDTETEQTITFEYKAEKEGKFIYKVKVDPLVSESIIIDNEKESQTEIISKSARVLLISGTSTWDFRMLQTLLIRDKTINVSSWLQSMDIEMMQEGNTPISKLPETEAELFEYDVVVMLDPNPAEIDEKWVLMLQKFIEERKGGLMYVAGPSFTSKTLGMIGTQKLKELLPVQFTELQREHKDFMKVTFETQWPLHLTIEGQSHYMGKLNKDNNINKSIWKNLPGIYWSYPAGEAKAGSKVLIDHTDPKLLYKEKNRPLLVTGVFGGGRTIYMGFNGIWRWRKNSEKYFDKFWIQSIRYLIEGKLEKESGKSNMYANKEKFVVGETINISAKIYDDLGQGFHTEKIIGKIYKGSNMIGEFLLRPEVNRKGFYEGEAKAEMQGDLTLILEPTELPFLKLEKKLKVDQPIIEYENPEMDYLGLQSLADKTNGKFYYLSDLGSLTKDFPNLKETVLVNLPPDSLWDSGRFFIIILILLSLEWTIRKKYKLL